MKKIVFFMIVTPRDTIIADYSIRGFYKLQTVLQAYEWTLQIYLNCLTDNQKKIYVPRWKKWSFVEIIDNQDWFDKDSISPGEKVFFNGISSRPYEGKYEIGCMIWEREFRKMQSEYWCIVDADFEIIETDFIKQIFQTLDNNDDISIYSTDYDAVVPRYNTYTNEDYLSMERYPTWFCVYKKECLACDTPMYYHEEIRNGKKCIWDDTGKFQEDLKTQTQCRFMSISQIKTLTLREKLMYQYIHYGAFSKNISLDTPWKIYFYRKIVILSHRGLLMFDRKNIINKVVRFLFTKMRNFRYGYLKIERGKYQF